MSHKILIVEDEAALVQTLGDRLRAEGYTVESASDGEQGLDKASRTPYDLILLDIMLPKKNGTDVCRDLRQIGVGTPVLMLTAKGQTLDKVLGLKIGADDYLTKPFEMMELLARVEALLRRATAPAPGNSAFYRFGSISVDVRRTQVLREEKPVPLSAREFQLLKYFIEHSGTTLTREQLLKDVWGYNATTFTRTVDVHIVGLRQKLEVDPKRPALIRTIPGLGYQFVG